jgi:hypothetical protein
MTKKNRMEYQKKHVKEFETLVDQIHWRYVKKHNCEDDVPAPELSEGRIYPHEFLFLLSNAWDLFDAMSAMCKELPQLDRETETFL